MNEAIRLSLMEAEESERKRKAEEAKKQQQEASATSSAGPSTSSSAIQSTASSPRLNYAGSTTSSTREAALSNAVQSSILPPVEDLSLTSHTSSPFNRQASVQANPIAMPDIPVRRPSITATALTPTSSRIAPVPILSQINSDNTSSAGRPRYMSTSSNYPDDNASVLMGPYGTSVDSMAPSINPLMSRSEEGPSTVLDTPASEISEIDFDDYNTYAQLADDDEDGPQAEGDRPKLVQRRTDTSDLMQL